MTYRYAFVKWLGSASLVMAMTGCPGGDDEDTGAETNPVPTTSVGTDSTTGGDTSDCSGTNCTTNDWSKNNSQQRAAAGPERGSHHACFYG